MYSKIKAMISIIATIAGILTYAVPLAAESDNGSFDLGRPTWDPIIVDQDVYIGLCVGPEGEIHRSLEEIVQVANDQFNSYVEWLSNGNVRLRTIAGRVVQGSYGPKTSHGNTFEALLCDDIGVGPPCHPDCWGFWGALDGGYSDGAVSYFGASTSPYDSRTPADYSYLRRVYNRYLNPQNAIDEWYYQLIGFRQHLERGGFPVILRYWNGWIQPDSIEIYQHRAASYALQPTGKSGVQMLVIPVISSLSDAYMYVLGGRVESPAGYDGALTHDGVEIYSVRLEPKEDDVCIDKTGQIATLNWVINRPPGCWRISLADDIFYPYVDALVETARGESKPPSLPPYTDRDYKDYVTRITPGSRVAPSLYVAGESLWIEGNLVSIDERDGDAFRVTITPLVEIDWDAVRPWWDGRFRDDDGNVHEGAIDALAERGIVSGYPDKTFNPTAQLTRADMAVMLARALGADSTPSSSESHFTDIADDAEYRPAVNYLAEIGVTRGYNDGTFRPDEAITRAQFASFIVRAFSQFSPVETPAREFSDVAVSSSHASAIYALYEAGVTKGCGTTPTPRYCPSEFIGRDQSASFLARVLGLTS